MTDEERASYRRQFEQAERGLLKREVITGCRWEDGRLTVTVGRREKATPEPEPVNRTVKRGAAQAQLL